MWDEDAACRGMDVTDFEVLRGRPTTSVRLRNATKVCASCPVKLECFVNAMIEEGAHVAAMRALIRAGTTPTQRFAMYVWFRRGQDIMREYRNVSGTGSDDQ